MSQEAKDACVFVLTITLAISILVGVISAGVYFSDNKDIEKTASQCVK